VPLPIVVSEAEGIWVTDPEGNKYIDMLSAYSAVNQGHRHPKIIQALKHYADNISIYLLPSGSVTQIPSASETTIGSGT
jgi:ornithine--oxo-acid transaminase